MHTFAKKLLDQLDTGSRDEAEMLEDALGVRFREFTRENRRVWVQQRRYLERFSETRTATTAARYAGVMVHVAWTWERLNTLGFARRLEVAELEFCDTLEELALECAHEPKSTPTLITALLSAHLPSKYSSEHERSRSNLEALLTKDTKNG